MPSHDMPEPFSLPRSPSAGAGARPGVSVQAPGRLHLGFLDPSASLGRRFGSLGLVIDGFETEVHLRLAKSWQVDAGTPAAQGEVARAAVHLAALQQRSGRHEPVHLHIARSLPAHAGFGSGTQLALAIGRAFAWLHKLELSTDALAGWLGRGRRSGIGIAGFDQGGLLLDGGPGRDGTPAPLLSRLTLPAAWRVLLVIDPDATGLSGDDEKTALAGLQPLPREAAADLCHHVVMRVLPGAASDDFEAFAEGINRVQQVIGGHFAPAQNGSAYSSPRVARLVEWIAEHSGAACGQSSWGPTGFAILPTAKHVASAVAAAHAAGVVDAGLQLHTVRARSHGALVHALHESAALHAV